MPAGQAGYTPALQRIGGARDGGEQDRGAAERGKLESSSCNTTGRAFDTPGDIVEAEHAMADGHLRVELERSGGFTGLRRCAAIDTATLPDTDAQQLRELVGGLDLEALAQQRGDPRLPTLDLTIVHGAHRVHATLDESNVPAQPC